MTSFYQQMAITADKLIAQFGCTCEVHLQKDGEYNVETGEVEKVSTEKLTGNCYINHQHYDFNLLNSGANSIKQGDVLMYITINSNVDRKMLLNSEVVVGNDTYQVVNCEPLKPADTTVMYKVQARIE
ncbi:hypothetical protein [Phocoenobacter skyensis]|uniref:Uncharacterized protein n=1 Tax=Phocoenobacter skyensis TaxID=97481 RepID=A0A1H7ZYQ6_9PAST|nr:hypothetical protein [Pasteurella skyensis]MDP8184405.1 hypothetical protein [Pasteurella skyensis]QLB22593.1 hypothetical protein A6B44_04985 [Pasteurella skyensis]SEM63461.1 hypothetical protein SAMN05444853_1335 [Pasteurella skyensis]